MELKIPPVLLTVLFCLLMWLVSGLTPGIDIPAGLKIAGLLIFSGIAAYVGVAAVLPFRKSATTVNPMKPEASSALVTSGIFRRSRNPMYLALLLFLIGWGIYLSNLYSLLAVAVFVLYLTHFQIRVEEKVLERLFGAEFTDYKKRVRRWI
jgi:protein-S-isoprenylcysteine O-methyltransferase Ste14